MGLLVVIILALWKAQEDVRSASHILHCCVLNKEKNYQTNNSFLILVCEDFCTCHSMNGISHRIYFLDVIALLSILSLQPQKRMVGLHNYIILWHYIVLHKCIWSKQCMAQTPSASLLLWSLKWSLGVHSPHPVFWWVVLPDVIFCPETLLLSTVWLFVFITNWRMQVYVTVDDAGRSCYWFGDSL